MSHLLKRNEGLTEGLQRVSQELLSDLLQAIGREKLTPGQVHDARKIIKNLRAMLRLTRGALSDEARRAGNQALRKLAGPRDAVVTLAVFEDVYREGLDGDPRPKVESSWATQLHQSLAEKAHALVPVESYQDGPRKFGASAASCYPSRMFKAKAAAEKGAVTAAGRLSSTRACEKLTVRAEG
jgi:hypothetical protein